MPVTVGSSVSYTDINAGKLVYTFSGAGDALGFQVRDNGGNNQVSDGVHTAQNQDTDPVIRTLNVTLLPVANHAPVSTPAVNVSAQEDAYYPFQVTDFNFTDPNDTPANNLKAVIIDQVPTSGKLFLLDVNGNPTQITTTGFAVQRADIAIGHFVYLSPLHSGAITDTFKFRLQDDGGTDIVNSAQGVDTEAPANSHTATVNVTHVHHAPVTVSTPTVTTQKSGYTFQLSDFVSTTPATFDPNDVPATPSSASRSSTRRPTAR